LRCHANYQLDVESYEDVIRTALADRAFLPIVLVCTPRSCFFYLHTWTGGCDVISRTREGEGEGVCAARGRAGAAKRLWRTPLQRRYVCIMESELWHSIVSVVELINIPCSLAARNGTARRPVFPRNKQTRRCYDTGAE